MVDFESIRNTLNGVLSDLDTEISNLRRSSSTDFNKIKTLLGEFEQVLSSDKQLENARIGEFDEKGIKADDVYRFIEQYQQKLREKIARYKESLRDEGKRNQLDTLVKEEIDEKDTAKSQKRLEQLNARITARGNAEDITLDAANAQYESLDKRIKLAQGYKIAEAQVIADGHASTPADALDYILNTVLVTTKNELDKACKKEINKQKKIERLTPDRIKENIEKITKVLANKRYKKSDYTLSKKEYNQLMQEIEELKLLKDGNPEIEAFLTEAEKYIDTTAKKLKDVDPAQLDEVRRKKDGAIVLDFENVKENSLVKNDEEYRDALIALIEKNPVFTANPNEHRMIMDKLKSNEYNQVFEIIERKFEVSNLARIEKELKKASKDSQNIGELENKRDSAKTAATTIEKRKIGEVANTKSITILGKTIADEDRDLLIEGTDRASVRAREELVERLCTQVRESMQEEVTQELESRKQFKPTLLQRFLHRLSHGIFFTNGLTAQYNNQREAAIRRMVEDKLADLKTQKATNPWMLSKDELEQARQKEEEMRNNRRNNQIESDKKARTEAINPTGKKVDEIDIDL